MKRRVKPVVYDDDTECQTILRDKGREQVPSVPVTTPRQFFIPQTCETPTYKFKTHPHVDPTADLYQDVHEHDSSVRKVSDTNTRTHEATCKVMDEINSEEDRSSAMPNTPATLKVCDDRCDRNNKTIALTENTEKPASAEMIKLWIPETRLIPI